MRVEKATILLMVTAICERAIAVLLMVAIVCSVYPQTTSALVGSCSVSVSVTALQATTSSSVDVTIRNTSAQNIEWVSLAIPGGFNYGGNSVGNWSVADTPVGLDASGFIIAPGANYVFSLAISAGTVPGSSGEWTVRVSDDVSGQDPTVCSGNPRTSIIAQAPQDQNVGVSNVSVDALTDTSATLSWNTDISTDTVVYYGSSASYGAISAYQADLQVAHQVTISGLSAETIYHFQVVGHDGSGTYVYSTDNTFKTGPGAVVQKSNIGQAIPRQFERILPKVKNPTSKPPTVQIVTDTTRPFKIAPLINGSASDDGDIAAVLYSTDGGTNWLPVASLSVTGSFSFTPVLPKDGTYSLMVSAVDNEGQSSTGQPFSITIDAFAPVIGAASVSVGAVGIPVGAVMDSAIGISNDLLLSVDGGVTKLFVTARQVGKGDSEQVFSFSSAIESTLWSGALSFNRSGTYTITATAIDGAGNRDDKQLFMIRVRGTARVVDAKGDGLAARFIVYHQNIDTQQWRLWDAASYNQYNPFKTGKLGGYGLLLPPGTYYIKVSAEGFHQQISERFTLKQPTTITDTIVLAKKKVFNVGDLSLGTGQPTFMSKPYKPTITTNTEYRNPIQRMPRFKMQTVDDKPITNATLYGKTSVISFISLWSAQAGDQLRELSEMPDDVHVLAVVVGDDAAKVASYANTAGYKFPIIADKQGTLASSFGVNVVPSQFIVDNGGEIAYGSFQIISNEDVAQYEQQKSFRRALTGE